MRMISYLRRECSSNGYEGGEENISFDQLDFRNVDGYLSSCNDEGKTTNQRRHGVGGSRNLRPLPLCSFRRQIMQVTDGV